MAPGGGQRRSCSVTNSRSAGARRGLPSHRKQRRENQTGGEAADVRHVGHAPAGFIGHGDRTAADELRDDPQPEHEERRHRHHAAPGQHVDPVAREHQQVAAEHAADRARRADGRNDRAAVEQDVRQARREPAREVEQHEPQVPEAMLDVVAENPEEQHVAAEVPPPAVQEHRGQERRPVRKWDERRQIGADGELARDDAPGEDEGLHGALRAG